MVEGIRFVLERRGFRAGRHTVGYGSCDDSTAQAGGTDVSRCFANAKLYARTPDVVGVIGAFHSFCSSFHIPIANQAPDGPLAMISPSNMVIGLTRPYRGMARGELERLYPAQAAEILLDAIARSDGTRASSPASCAAPASRTASWATSASRTRRPRRGARDDLSGCAEGADGQSRRHGTSDRRRLIASRARCGRASGAGSA